MRQWSSLPIVVLSAMDAGAHDGLTKALGTSELLARVRADLRRQRAAAGDADPARRMERFGGIGIDLAARTVRRTGIDVQPHSSGHRKSLVAHAGRILIQR